MAEIAILGAGPTGILVAAKVIEMGHTAVIFADRKPDKLYGAQYLHIEPPLLKNCREFDIHYTLQGSPQDYRRKVYGDSWDGTVSPQDILEHDHGWDIRQAYFELSANMGINYCKFIGYMQANEVIQFKKYPLVFSTIPRTVWKMPGEKFPNQKVWAIGENHSESLVVSIPMNTVICNADESPSWYRAANIDGYQTIEWPYHGDKYKVKPPLPGVTEIKKPLRYIPGPHLNPANSAMIHVGRYGKWEKGILVSDAIIDAEKAINEANL